MQVDSAAPFTSMAQQMGQATQTPPPPKAEPDHAEPAKASTAHGVGDKVDVKA